jgi:hypothetical protein
MKFQVSHVFQTIGSQLPFMLSALHAGNTSTRQFPGTISCYRRSKHQAVVWLEGLGKFKKRDPTNSSGIEPESCLKHPRPQRLKE